MGTDAFILYTEKLMIIDRSSINVGGERFVALRLTSLLMLWSRLRASRPCWLCSSLSIITPRCSSRSLSVRDSVSCRRMIGVMGESVPYSKESVQIQ